MITEAIIIAVITAAATVTSQVAISFRTNNLIVYRIDRLEEEVNKHNCLIERTHDLELALSHVQERAKSNTHRIDDLEHEK